MTEITDILKASGGETDPGFLRGVGEHLARGDDCFRDIVDVLPAAIYVTDASGHITYYNDAAATLWGRRPELGTAEWCGSWKLYWPDGRAMAHTECPMAIAVKERRPVFGMEALAERPDGVRVPFLPFPTPLYDALGNLSGAVNLLIDITDRKRAEQYAQQLASIVESSHDAIVSKNLDGVIMSWNQAAERLFGYTAEEIIGKSVTILMPADRVDEEPGILARIRSGECIQHYETVRQRKDGSLVDISLTVSPVRDGNGKVVGASKIARDITARKRAQEQQKLLAGEMRHRIKNSLTTVQALANQTLRSISTQERDAFTARLQALANAYDLLTAESWGGAQVGSIVAKALDAFRQDKHERVFIEGPDGIWVEANKSLPLSMALHELATNAVKYGALSNGSGCVRIDWKHAPETRRLVLHWRESGGPSVAPPKSEGFGSLLIQRVIGGAGGSSKIDFHPQGLSCTLEIAL
jgi:two-component system CheB/CheR fusion protein